MPLEDQGKALACTGAGGRSEGHLGVAHVGCGRGAVTRLRRRRGSQLCLQLLMHESVQALQLRLVLLGLHRTLVGLAPVACAATCREGASSAAAAAWKLHRSSG